MDIQEWRAAGSRDQMAGSSVVGRDGERVRIERALNDAAAGSGGVLVVSGDEGLGKTALLDRAVEQARAFRVLRARAVESEAAFPCAGLHLLVGPLADHVGRLPLAQRDALRAAVGWTAGPRPDPFLVGLATLDLFSAAAEPRPLLCVVDDAHWLDRPSAQVLAFVARRLEARPVLLLLGKRDAPRAEALDELHGLRLDRLSPADSRSLLARLLPGEVDPAVVDRIAAEARGNPRALVESVPPSSRSELAGGFGVPSAGEPLGPAAEDFLDRLGALPDDSQRLLLAAAAEPMGDPALLWRSAALLALPSEAARPLVCGGFLRIGSGVLFPRPFLRSVVYAVATDEERQRVHRALAAATDAGADPVRRAWHLAAAAVGPDDELAAELEHCARGAGQRGGRAAAAAFLEQAALLTLEPRTRGERALAAAAAQHRAGADDAAARLLEAAARGPLDDPARSRLERLRAQVALASEHGDDATDLLLRSAQELEELDPRLSRDSYLDALAAAVTTGRLGFAHTPADVAKAAEAGPAAVAPERPVDRLLDGLVLRCTQGYGAAAGRLERAVADLTGDADGRGPWLACLAAAELWDDEAWDRRTSVAVRNARESGALALLPAVLDERAVAELHLGDAQAAAGLVEEAVGVGTAVGSGAVPAAALLGAGWRGREEEAAPVFASARHQAVDRGEGRTLAVLGLAEAVLLTGLGRYDDAVSAARDASESDDLGLSGWALAELVEAAVRAGDRSLAGCALERLAERTGSSGTEWALGTEARSRAMLSDGAAADELFREAVQRLGRTRIRSALARTQLVHGEWLRRQGRRVDARESLRAALETFTAMGAEAFVERAHRELLATGEKARSRSGEACQELTPQETRIASLARDGLSNPAIGARIFVSPRTVEYHLHKVFSKLGISSRAELHLVLASAGDLG